MEAEVGARDGGLLLAWDLVWDYGSYLDHIITRMIVTTISNLSSSSNHRMFIFNKLRSPLLRWLRSRITGIIVRIRKVIILT